MCPNRTIMSIVVKQVQGSQGILFTDFVKKILSQQTLIHRINLYIVTQMVHCPDRHIYPNVPYTCSALLMRKSSFCERIFKSCIHMSFLFYDSSVLKYMSLIYFVSLIFLFPFLD